MHASYLRSQTKIRLLYFIGKKSVAVIKVLIGSYIHLWLDSTDKLYQNVFGLPITLCNVL